ncbi:Glutamate receptor ionotropic, kainate 4 [Sparganum proliferum]
MASWWMYVVLLQAAYQAELVAFLSRSEVIPPFETLEQLADDTAIIPLVARGSYAASIMEKAGPESTYGRLWKRTLTVSEAEGMEKILASPEFVYIDDEVTAGVMEDVVYRGISMMKETFAHSFCGFPIVAGTEYKRAFDSYIRRLKEAGIIQRLYSKWLTPLKRSDGPSVTEGSMTIDMNQSSGTFILLVISALVSLLSLGIEKLWFSTLPTLKAKWDSRKACQSVK